MKFEELLEIQRSLNLMPETPLSDVFMKDEKLKTAIAVEVGETLQCIKPDWVWWKRYGKEFNASSKLLLLGELADIFHFLLTACLEWGVKNGLDYEAYWNEPIGDMGKHSTAFKHLRSVIYYSENENTGKALRRFIWAVRLIGFTRKELEDAYKSKAQENAMRFQHAS